MKLRRSAAFALTLLSCGGGDGGSISREAAGQLVMDELVDENDPMIVFSYRDAVGSDTTLLVGTPSYLGDQERIAIERDAWFFWIDDEPGARFDHRNRFVLVDKQSGAITVHEELWGPVIDGDTPWADRSSYWDTDDWLYGPTEWRMGVVTPTPIDAGEACQPGFGTALVINGWEEGQRGGDDMAFDAQNMTTTLEGLGFDVTQGGTKGQAGVEVDKRNMSGWFDIKAKELKAGDNLVVYITGHGGLIEEEYQMTLGQGDAGGVYSGQLAKELAKFDPGVEIIVIVDACHSGAMLADLNCVADLAISAARDDQSSYGHLPGHDDPIEEGGEFTSALALSIRELMGDTSEVAHFEQVAMQQGGSFMGALLTDAGLRERMYDLAYKRGWSEPQFRAGSVKTKPTIGDPTPPMCDGGDPTDTNATDPDPTDTDPTDTDPTGDTDTDTSTGCGDAELSALALKLGDVIGADVEDAVCSGSIELPAGNSTLWSGGNKSADATEEVDWIKEGVILGVDLATDVPCGPGADYDVLCTGQTLPLAGPVAIVWGQVAAPIDSNEKTFSYQYGFVFDTDGDDGNDYVPGPQYPADFFAGTDQWFYTVHNAGEGWYTWASSAAAGFANVPSSERIIVAGDLVALVVNEDEVHPDTASYRITAFRHLGDYGQAMPWSGDLVPAVADGLTPLQ